MHVVPGSVTAVPYSYFCANSDRRGASGAAGHDGEPTSEEAGVADFPP